MVTEVMVVKPNPHPNADHRQGRATLEGRAPKSYVPIEGKPWVYVRWPDGAITTEPMVHVKKIAKKNGEQA